MNWYALHVRSQCERKVRDALDRQRIEQYLPLYTERTRLCDRNKTAERVLFPGYVFGRFEPETRRQVLDVPGLVSILGVGNRPEPLPEAEIEMVRRIVDSGAAVTPVPYLAAGQVVRIDRGALQGVEGVVVRMKNELRVVVSVNLLRRSVAAELDTDAVIPVQPLRKAA